MEWVVEDIIVTSNYIGDPLQSVREAVRRKQKSERAILSPIPALLLRMRSRDAAQQKEPPHCVPEQLAAYRDWSPAHKRP
jgi:hypothetical protein